MNNIQKPIKKPRSRDTFCAPKFKLHLQRGQTHFTTPKRSFFQRCINHSLKDCNKNIKMPELTIRIVDETEMLNLNQSFRGKSYPTNVLSFPLLQPSSDGDHNAEHFAISAVFANHYLGDIALCAAIIAKEAIEQNKDIQAHWAHLVVHGVLHLLGYDHVDASQAQAMETAEIAILNRLGYPNPYQ
jgi:probable rRNA maturation factor